VLPNRPGNVGFLKQSSSRAFREVVRRAAPAAGPNVAVLGGARGKTVETADL
jgi:hypothetical protein